MEVKSFRIPSEQDNLLLSGFLVVPSKNPVGIVQISHGMAEHKKRYLSFMKYLAENSYIAIINDHRGHGESIRSAEDLGYFYESGAVSLVEDLHQITKMIKREYQNLPLFLFGHSMGSRAARTYLQKYDEELSGLFVCGSPSFRSESKMGKSLIRFMSLLKGSHYRSPLLQNLLFGGYSKLFPAGASKNSWICANENTVKEYDDDPLCGFTFTLNGFYNLISLLETVYNPKNYHPKNKMLPISFISGANDPCFIDKERLGAAVLVLKQAGYQDVALKIYDNMRHEILNEENSSIVFSDVLETLEKWRNKEK